MIKLQKRPKPAVLERNADSWTKAVLEKLEQSLELAAHEKNKYNHPDVKAALIDETYGK